MDDIECDVVNCRRPVFTMTSYDTKHDYIKRTRMLCYQHHDPPDGITLQEDISGLLYEVQG